MKITIIGEIFYDVIYPYHGKKITSFGGTLYNLITLANFVDFSGVLYPISFLWKKHFPKVTKLCKPYPQIDFSGIIPSDKGTETARLTYISWGKREEKIILYHPPIPFHHIKKFLNVDAVLINFTARRDVSLSTLKKIRQSSKTLVMVDLHCLQSKINSKGIRYICPIPNWREWISCTDIVQGNQSETETLIGFGLKNDTDFKKAHREILKTGVKVAITTRGDRGVIVSWKKGGKIIFIRIPAIPIAKIVDTTGSGDVFTSVFLWKYLITNNLIDSVNYANKGAGMNCQLRGLEELGKLRKLSG